MESSITTHSLDLRHIVLINEKIKDVLTISEGSHLVAINSMLLAKSAGERLLGFGVVSSELKVFCRKLDAAMAILADLTFSLVHKAALQKKLLRERQHLLTTMEKQHRAEILLESTFERKDQALAELMLLVEQDTHRLAGQLGRSVRICKSGNALARCAKIEAAYGGEMHNTLMQVAEHIESTVQRILFTLDTLRAAIAE